MSIHKSLKKTKISKRTVKKRWERLRSLLLQQKWDREHSSIYKLPKEKVIKIKIIKDKKKKDEEESLADYAKESKNDKK